MQFVIQIVITGLTMGSMYALAAVGLSLIYGTLGMFNMAHGLFMTFGGYMAYSAATAFGIPLVLGIVVAMVAAAAIGMVTAGLASLAFMGFAGLV